ncbi:hypothetical protein ACP3S7_10940 [Phytobacter ursingii]
MATITINTYDPEGRFDMDKEEAKVFFKFVEAKAIEAGYDVAYDEAIYVDAESEEFVSNIFANY